jgi:GxxExxY protein
MILRIGEIMPITHRVEIKTLSDEEFYLLDHKVMGLAFAIQREFGRFWNETIYQNKLADSCQKAGFAKVATEVPIRVSYNDFSTFYSVDLLVENAVVYELKAVRALSGEHSKQTLNYLFLLGMQRGKLINMQPSSVEHRFVSTRITPEKRYAFVIDDSEWHDRDEDSIWLKELMTNLVKEWGAFLGVNLFYEAIYHFRGGEENVVKTIEIKQGANIFGSQKVHLINSGVAFKISAITKGETYYEQDLRRFIRIASLRALQWINFNHEKIVFKTILP